ncbi:hypothetical protein [Streptomyces sp. NPDC050504]|uniref:hypothetical protein n=1 Tax=Streptomyces sp. NPDC050504 TaxID=3365618 RepID=UPI0037B4BC6E
MASERAGGGAGDPAASPLCALLPGGRIRPGTAVSTGGDMPLLLALAAEASAGTAGWAAVGLPHLGALAAESAGLDLRGGLRVDRPGRHVVQVLATLIEAAPVVLAGPLDRVSDRAARRLTAALRRSGSILLSSGPLPGAEIRMRVVSASWEGVGEGHGLLHGRRVRIAATGRGAAAAPRYAEMWLPGPSGAAAPVRDAVDAAPDGVPAPTGLRPELRAAG